MFHVNWVKLEGEIATIGVTKLGVKKTKEIAFIELPVKGDKFKRGEEYAVMEAVKWAGSLKMPLSGEVIEVNEKLIDDPSLLNKDPYQNWIAKIKIERKEEIEKLMGAKEAREFYGKE